LNYVLYLENAPPGTASLPGEGLQPGANGFSCVVKNAVPENFCEASVSPFSPSARFSDFSFPEMGSIGAAILKSLFLREDSCEMGRTDASSVPLGAPPNVFMLRGERSS